jgi:hypothetical protein
MATHTIAVTDYRTVIAERLTHEEQRAFQDELANLVRARLRELGQRTVAVRGSWGTGCQYYRHGIPMSDDAMPRRLRAAWTALDAEWRALCARALKRARARLSAGGPRAWWEVDHAE